MPRLTKILHRRDTAANWSSTNPTLDSSEIGYDSTNKMLKIGDGSTAWNSLGVMAQQGSTSAARPLLTGGAYLDGSTGLVLSGLVSNYASSPDSAALDITGDIDIKVKVAMTDWTPAVTRYLVSKYANTGNARGYTFNVRTDGTLRLQWSTDGTAGTLATADSTVATGFTDGATKWVRVTMDVDNGASQRVIKFYTSDDATTWTQLGTTVTAAGATSIFANAIALNVGGLLDFGEYTPGTFGRVIIQSAYDTANNTTSLAFDANFATQTADALAFTESSTNAATVTINTTRYSYGLPGVQWQAVTTSSFGAARDFYHPFLVTKAISVDMAQLEVTTGPASPSTMYVGVYQADEDFQPTGAPVINDSIAVGTSATGVFRKQFTPVVLQPGAYLLALNATVALSMRVLRGGFTTGVGTMGANPYIVQLYRDRTAAAFPSSPVPYNTTFGSSSGFIHFALLRWKAA